MADYLIIDGYNIIHSWDCLKDLKDNDLGHARTRLMDMACNYQALTGVKVIIVFDAHMVKKGQGTKENNTGVEVVYTSEGETADMFIEKLVGQLSLNNRVTVATSDWAQQRIVFGKGAVRLSSRELEKEIKSLNEAMQKDYLIFHNHDSKLGGYLKDNIKEVLERIRRQK